MSVTATGYSAPGTETALFNKQEGGDETGLGLAAMSDNEVGPGNFIQLDLNQLANGGTTNGWLTLGSVQPGEGFMVCDSSTAGSMAGATCFTSGLDGQPVAISWSSGAPFIDITATTGNVLLDGLTLASAVTGGIDTPEPGTTMLLLLGAPALLFAARRRLARIAS